MTHTARAKADCKEFFDPPDVLDTKIKKLAKLAKRSKHVCMNPDVFFTIIHVKTQIFVIKDGCFYRSRNINRKRNT